MDDSMMAVVDLASRHAPPGHPVSVGPQTTLRDFGLGSLAVVALIADIEREFGIRFEAGMMNHEVFATFGSITAAIAQLRAAEGPSAQRPPADAPAAEGARP